MQEKTLILFNSVPEEFCFFELEGNFSHLNGVYIGAMVDDNLVNELTNLIYDKEGKFVLKELEQPTKDWNYFIHCGILL